MGRQLHYGKDGISLQLTGVTQFCAFKNRIDIPYANIIDVQLTDFRSHFLFPMWAGTAIPPFIYEGRFRHQQKWYFVSFESLTEEPLIQIQLKECAYDFVIFKIDHAEEHIEKIERSISQLVSSNKTL